MMKVSFKGACVSLLVLVLLSSCNPGTTGSNPIVVETEEYSASV